MKMALMSIDCTLDVLVGTPVMCGQIFVSVVSDATNRHDPHSSGISKQAVAAHDGSISVCDAGIPIKNSRTVGSCLAEELHATCSETVIDSICEKK